MVKLWEQQVYKTFKEVANVAHIQPTAISNYRSRVKRQEKQSKKSRRKPLSRSKRANESAPRVEKVSEAIDGNDVRSKDSFFLFLLNLKLSHLYQKLVEGGIASVDDLREIDSKQELVEDFEMTRAQARKLVKHVRLYNESAADQVEVQN